MVPPNDDNLVMLPEDRVITLSEIVESAKKNYIDRVGIKITLEQLQEWVRKQQELYK